MTDHGRPDYPRSSGLFNPLDGVPNEAIGSWCCDCGRGTCEAEGGQECDHCLQMACKDHSVAILTGRPTYYLCQSCNDGRNEVRWAD